MRRPKTRDEYLDLIQQAIFELDELRACDYWNHEDNDSELDFIDPLQTQLNNLHEQISTYTDFTRQNCDLPWINIVRINIREIPFANLFDLINQTYRLGFEQ